jgi:hypothetical protein
MREHQTAPSVHIPKARIKITHPFHPRYGEEYDLLCFYRSWGRDYVECSDEKGKFITIPTEYTASCEIDPFVTISQGRSIFRVSDLLRLVEFLSTMKETL